MPRFMAVSYTHLLGGGADAGRGNPGKGFHQRRFKPVGNPDRTGGGSVVCAGYFRIAYVAASV